MQDNLRRRPRKRQANTANNLRKSHIQDGGYRALKIRGQKSQFPISHGNETRHIRFRGLLYRKYRKKCGKN